MGEYLSSFVLSLRNGFVPGKEELSAILWAVGPERCTAPANVEAGEVEKSVVAGRAAGRTETKVVCRQLESKEDKFQASLGKIVYERSFYGDTVGVEAAEVGGEGGAGS